MPKPLPDAEILDHLFAFEAGVGILIWKPRPREMFNSDMAFHRWNGAYAGKAAGRITSSGYRNIKVMGEAFQAHRLIWKLVTGEDPGEIDHKNRNKLDNRMENLRVVSRSENMRNKGVNANNACGEKHIHWMPKLQRWTVQLMVPGKGQRQLAWCKTLGEAVAVRNRLYLEYGYK